MGLDMYLHKKHYVKNWPHSYDEYYLQEIKATKKILEEELKNPSKSGTYYYQSSW